MERRRIPRDLALEVLFQVDVGHLPLEEVLSLATVAAVERTGYSRNAIAVKTAGLRGARRMHFFDMPRIDISSSMVRLRAHAGRPIRYLVPEKVARFVEAEELYGAAAGGKVYVFGGLAPGWQPRGLVLEYEPATDTWTKKKPKISSAASNRSCVARAKVTQCGWRWKPIALTTSASRSARPRMKSITSFFAGSKNIPLMVKSRRCASSSGEAKCTALGRRPSM